MPAVVRAAPDVSPSTKALAPADSASASPKVSASLIAPYGSRPDAGGAAGGAAFPTYARPIYPFVKLNDREPLLQPPPEDQDFGTYREAIDTLQEHGLAQGYKLQRYYKSKDLNGLRCETGNDCQFFVKLECYRGHLVPEPVYEHNHGPDLEVGIRYWQHNLTSEEFQFVLQRKREGHLKTIEEAQATIHASRRRLFARASRPDIALFDHVWNCDARIDHLYPRSAPISERMYRPPDTAPATSVAQPVAVNSPAADSAAVQARPDTAASPSSSTSVSSKPATPTTAAPAAAAAAAPTPVIAPLGTVLPELADAPFPTYSRPVYPFAVLDSTKARLQPLPKDQIFRTQLEAEHALQEHGLHQGYKLEVTWDAVLKRWWKCSTGSQCRYAVKVRKISDGAWNVESGVQGLDKHSHGPSLRVGTFYWARHLTKEEIQWLRRCQDLDRLKTIGELPALIKASRKRLGSNVPMPNQSVLDSLWYSLLYFHPKAIREDGRLIHPSPSRTFPASSAPIVSSSVPTPAEDATPLEVAKSLEPGLPFIGSTSFVVYQYSRPIYPFVVLNPAKAVLRQPPTGQVFTDMLEATYALQEHALMQGFELKSDGGRPEGRLQCQGAPGCPYRFIIRERGRTNIWDLIDCHEKHNHSPDLEIGQRHWGRGLTGAEIDHIRARKRQHELMTIEFARAEVEASRRRLHRDLPMPRLADYDDVWNSEPERSRRAKRPRTMPASQPEPAVPAAAPAPTASQTVASSSPLVQSAPAATISINFTPPLASSVAQHNFQTTQGTLIDELARMIHQLWPNGVQDPQGKVRAAVKAMLDHDLLQQQQQQP